MHLLIPSQSLLQHASLCSSAVTSLIGGDVKKTDACSWCFLVSIIGNRCQLVLTLWVTHRVTTNEVSMPMELDVLLHLQVLAIHVHQNSLRGRLVECLQDADILHPQIQLF